MKNAIKQLAIAERRTRAAANYAARAGEPMRAAELDARVAALREMQAALLARSGAV